MPTANQVRQQLRAACPECAREGCSYCEGEGEVPASCDGCGAPAFQFVHRDPVTGVFSSPACDQCAGLCSLCTAFALPNDRIPWGDRGAVAHAFCAMSYSLKAPLALLGRGAPQFLEVLHSTEETVITTARARARARTRGDVEPMAKPSKKLVQRMREEGYIPTAEAVQLSHHALSTIYGWIADEEDPLPARRAGLFHFVELAALEARCPQIRPQPVPQAAAGGER